MNLLRHLPRFRRVYRELATLEARERWSRPEIETFQLDRLNRLWGHAVGHVPYYRTLRTASRLPERFSSLQEFRSTVPMLPKQRVSSRTDEFLSEIPDRGRWYRTGGSTGIPTKFYWSTEAHLEMLRAKYRRDAMWGLDLFDPQVFLWGHADSFAPGLAGYVARMRQPIADTLRKRLRLSAYRLGAQDLARYLERIAAFGPASLYGYSTALYLLAQQAEILGLRCDSVKLSILTGEPALAPVRQTVERAFNAPAVVEYGATECSVIATQWPDGTLRVREDLTLLETSPNPDGRFDIVITVLNNPAFPLIRYAIQDVTSAPVEVPAIGFAILKDVEGRRNDILVSRTGRFVHSMAVKHVFENCPGVRRFRAHQNPSGALFILVEPAGPHARLDTSQAERQLRDLLEGYPITLQIVASIPVSGAGKHRWVVSELAGQRLADASCGRDVHPPFAPERR